MSKAAENMMGVLLSLELKKHGIIVTLLHPGFNKTDMTKKYEKIWEIEGAVDSDVGAKRVIHEIGLMNNNNDDTVGAFINSEDGLKIPW
jgi:NAD(P)-dependent dehydrogenase (short-subunit alcohol dehydrogenase family)